MNESGQFRPDVVLTDTNGDTVAIVEVKYHIRDLDRRYFYGQLQRYLTNVTRSGVGPFTIVVDRDTIEIFRGAPGESEPIRLETSLLAAYDAGYGARSEHESYLVRLIELWLDDVAHHWRFNPAPAEERLPSGLVDALRAA